MISGVTFASWREKRWRTVHAGGERTDYPLPCTNRVTALIYSWGRDDFFLAEFAIRETFLHCGTVPTVIVTNRVTVSMAQFAARFPMVTLQIEPMLVAGDIDSMSIDCNSRLASRFSTDYVLIIQEDGFPLREGIEQFLDSYDFIGAPYVGDVWWKKQIAAFLGYWMQNGGFSLRSRKICELANSLWHTKYQHLARTLSGSEDLYYTQYLPLHNWEFRRKIRLAPRDFAAKFSLDKVVPTVPPAELPFGFHRAITLEMLIERFGI